MEKFKSIFWDVAAIVGATILIKWGYWHDDVARQNEVIHFTTSLGCEYQSFTVTNPLIYTVTTTGKTSYKNCWGTWYFILPGDKLETVIVTNRKSFRATAPENFFWH